MAWPRYPGFLFLQDRSGSNCKVLCSRAKTSHSLEYTSIPLVMSRLGFETLMKYIQSEAKALPRKSIQQISPCMDSR